MFESPSVIEVATTRPDLYAFRITKEVSADDMEAMSEYMNAIFDKHDTKIDMMLIFDRYDGAEAGASWSWEAIKSRIKATANVNRYVVVGAPDKAASLIETMGRLIPVEAETYDHEDAAWRSLNAEARAA